MIVLVVGASLVVFSLFRAIISGEALGWAKEFNRIILGLMVMGAALLTEWGSVAVIFDSMLLLLGFFVIRANIQAKGESGE